MDAEEHRQRWNGAAGHAWLAAAPWSIDCSSRSPIDSPIWQPRLVPISWSTLAAGREARRCRARAGWEPRRHASAFSEPTLSAARGAAPKAVTAIFMCANAQTYPFEPESFRPDPTRAAPRALNVSAVFRLPWSEFLQPCAVNCAVIVTPHDASGDTGQNCD